VGIPYPKGTIEMPKIRTKEEKEKRKFLTFGGRSIGGGVLCAGGKEWEKGEKAMTFERGEGN